MSFFNRPIIARTQMLWEEEMKCFEGVVFVASAIQMHEIRSNLILFTHWWLEKPSVKLENR